MCKMLVKEKISLDDNMIFQRLYEEFISLYDGRIVMSHFGSFSQDFVNSLAEGLEHIMINNGSAKILVKRVFSIMIEQLQNIRIHGHENEIEKQIGHVMVNENKGEYNMSFGNLVSKEDVDRLTSYFEHLNTLNEHEIKQKYLEVLGNGILTESNGVGLGLITVVMKSKSKIEYQFLDYNEKLDYLEMKLNIQ